MNIKIQNSKHYKLTEKGELPLEKHIKKTYFISYNLCSNFCFRLPFRMPR